MILFIWNMKNKLTHRDGKQISGCLGLAVEGMGSDRLIKMWFSFGAMKIFGIRGDGCKTLWMY